MIDKNSLYQNLNRGIISERFYSFKRNLKKNQDLIIKFGGLKSVLPNFNNKNIVVIGAGPSLDRSIVYLKKFQNRDDIILIAADMAFRPLMNFGVKPDYVISCETNPVDFFGEVATSDIHLLAFSCMSNINLRKWDGNISFYNWMLHGPEYDSLWEIAGKDLGYIATGSIITTQSIALVLGCNIKSLMLTGNDLGFRNRFYIRDSIPYVNNYLKSNRFNSSETLEKQMTRRSRDYEIKRGEKIFYTNNQFLAAKMWLEELFQGKGIPVYDCSEPGCSEKYVIKIDVKDYFKLFERKKRRKRR